MTDAERADHYKQALLDVTEMRRGPDRMMVDVIEALIIGGDFDNIHEDWCLCTDIDGDLLHKLLVHFGKEPAE